MNIEKTICIIAEHLNDPEAGGGMWLPSHLVVEDVRQDARVHRFCRPIGGVTIAIPEWREL